MSHPTLSLCMIVRDSTRTLATCLESIRHWVDELVVVDTGSTDSTRELARQFGARVSEFEWCDDFAAARNESLRHALGRWIFWMDADDTIDADNGQRLRELAGLEHAENVLGFVMQVVCPGSGEDGANDCTVVDHVKLIRNLPQLRFEGRIHEQILPAIRRQNGDVQWTDIHVVHSGADQTPAGRKLKQERDLRILLLEYAEQPQHPFTLFNLGMTYADMNQHRSAVEHLNRSIALSNQGDSHLRKAYSLLINSLQQLCEPADAEAVCNRARSIFPDDPELLFRHAVLLHRSGQFEAAEEAYLKLLAYRGDRYFASIDPTITGFKARQNLAAVYHDMGRVELAELQWRQVVREVPDYRLGWRSLVQTLLDSRRFQTAEVEIERMLSSENLASSARLMRGRLRESLGDYGGAREDILAAIQHDVTDADALEALCRLLFNHGQPFEARLALAELSNRLPDDPAVFRNLGVVHSRLGELEAAVRAFDRSLQLRPDAAQTLREMAAALDQLGRSDESTAAIAKASAIEAHGISDRSAQHQ